MSMNWFDLSGRVALVTGASRGIGKTIALALARAGADVAVCSRSASDLNAVAQGIQVLGRRAVAIPADVTREDEVGRLVQETLAAMGHVDILVNNAGVGTSRPLLELDPQDWQQVMSANVLGPMLCCKHLGPHMIERRKGKVLNVASVLATRPARYMSLYSASKAALVQFTRVLALEWVRFNVQVNAICPGYFLTDMNREFFSTERGQRFIRELPMRRLGELTELEGAAIFLASDASSYITGTCLYVDGGYGLS